MFTAATRGGTATGFFFANADESRLFLITNRHVVKDEAALFFPDKLRLRLHVDRKDLKLSESFEIDLYPSGNPAWREISSDTDVVAIELDASDVRRRFYFASLNPTNFIPPDVVLGVGDPLLIVGYPEGFYDEKFNLPIVRQGSVASVFPVPFNDNPFFLADAILHPGTSGSPVVTQPARAYMGFGGVLQDGLYRSYLVGINSGSYDSLHLNAVWFNNMIEQLIK
jgi:S1-C subfamily serine protease